MRNRREPYVRLTDFYQDFVVHSTRFLCISLVAFVFPSVILNSPAMVILNSPAMVILNSRAAVILNSRAVVILNSRAMVILNLFQDLIMLNEDAEIDSA